MQEKDQVVSHQVPYWNAREGEVAQDQVHGGGQEKIKERSLKFHKKMGGKINKRRVKFYFEIQEKIKSRSTKFHVEILEKIK